MIDFIAYSVGAVLAYYFIDYEGFVMYMLWIILFYVTTKDD